MPVEVRDRNMPCVIGLSENEAAEHLKAAGFSYRVSSKDGTQFIVTRDWDPGRINLDIENDKVIRATAG